MDLAHGWIVQQALPDVPAAFRASCLNRNETNRDLLALTGRRLGLRVPPVPAPASGAEP